MRNRIAHLARRLHFFLWALPLALLLAGAGCGGVAPPEEVGATQQALYSCPEKTWCYDACASVGDGNWYWGGLCKDDGACRCQYDRGSPGTGSGWNTYFCYMSCHGSCWECIPSY